MPVAEQRKDDKEFSFSKGFDANFHIQDVSQGIRALAQVTEEVSSIELRLENLQDREERGTLSEADKASWHKTETALLYKKHYKTAVEVRLDVLRDQEKLVKKKKGETFLTRLKGTVFWHFYKVAQEELEPIDFQEMLDEARKRTASGNILDQYTPRDEDECIY